MAPPKEELSPQVTEVGMLPNYARGGVSLPKRTTFGTLREPYCFVKQKGGGRIAFTRQKN